MSTLRKGDVSPHDVLVLDPMGCRCAGCLDGSRIAFDDPQLGKVLDFKVRFPDSDFINATGVSRVAIYKLKDAQPEEVYVEIFSGIPYASQAGYVLPQKKFTAKQRAVLKTMGIDQFSTLDETLVQKLEDLDTYRDDEQVSLFLSMVSRGATFVESVFDEWALCWVEGDGKRAGVEFFSVPREVAFIRVLDNEEE